MGDPGSGLLMEHVCRWVHTSLFVSSGPPGELREPPSHSASQRRLQSGPGQRVYRGQHLQTAALRPPLPVGAAHQDANTHQHSQRAHTLQRNQHSWLARRSGQKERHTHTHTHTVKSTHLAVIPAMCLSSCGCWGVPHNPINERQKPSTLAKPHTHTHTHSQKPRHG